MKPFTPPLLGLEELAPGVGLCPASRVGAALVGNRRSRMFHKLTCWHGRQIRPDNQVCFLDWQAAADYYYVPCSKCKPLEGPKVVS